MMKMRHVYFSFIFITVLIFGALLPARIGGTLVSKPRLVNLLSDPDGSACVRPCFLGIRPGRMSFRAATSLIKRHPLVEWYDPVYCGKASGQCSFKLRGFGGGEGVIVGQDLGREEISVVDIYVQWYQLPPDIPTLGEVVAAFGSPRYVLPHNGFECCSRAVLPSYLNKLERFSETYGVTMYYPNYGIEVTDRAVLNRSGGYALTPKTPLLGFRVFEPYRICDHTKQYWDGWDGFGDLSRYFDRQTMLCTRT